VHRKDPHKNGERAESALVSRTKKNRNKKKKSPGRNEQIKAEVLCFWSSRVGLPHPKVAKRPAEFRGNVRIVLGEKIIAGEGEDPIRYRENSLWGSISRWNRSEK